MFVLCPVIMDKDARFRPVLTRSYRLLPVGNVTLKVDLIPDADAREHVSLFGVSLLS